MLKKYNILFILFIIYANTYLHGQQPITPPPPVCPGEKGMQYFVDGSNKDSYYTWFVVGGTPVNDGKPNDDSITIDWIESSDIISYSLKVIERSPQGCEGDTVSVDIGFKDNSKVILLDGAPNAIICEDSILELVPSGGDFIEYEWNDGVSHAKTHFVTESAQYWVHVTNADGCQSSDTVAISVVKLPEIEIGDTIQPCNETIELDAGHYETTRWSTGSIDQVIEVGEVDYDSLIWVKVTDFYGCSASDSVLVIKCIDAIDVPTAFTPNDDGFNDTWVIDGIERFENAEVRVYNRKKVLVFESTGEYEPWDGNAENGRVLPVDSYHYVIDLKDPNQKIEQGFVTIVY